MYFRPTSARSSMRKLRRHDLTEIAAHFLRLDQPTRRARFGSFLNDDLIGRYATHFFDDDPIAFGAFRDGRLRAIGELRSARPGWMSDAEIALSVEPGWQGQGIGSALFERIVTAARNRGMKLLHVLFLNENERMRRITAKHHPEIEFHGGEVEATLDPPWPTPFSIAEEMIDDANAYVQSVYERDP